MSETKTRTGAREAETFVLLQRAASELAQPVAELLKGEGLSSAQYNVLRILRGAGPAGLPCGEVAARLITRDPDVTRLLDRMEKQGLVTRARDSEDRRVVTTRLTPQGRELVDRLDEPVAQLHARQLGHLGADRLAELAELLEQAMGGAQR